MSDPEPLHCAWSFVCVSSCKWLSRGGAQRTEPLPQSHGGSLSLRVAQLLGPSPDVPVTSSGPSADASGLCVNTRHCSIISHLPGFSFYSFFLLVLEFPSSPPLSPIFLLLSFLCPSFFLPGENTVRIASTPLRLTGINPPESSGSGGQVKM